MTVSSFWFWRNHIAKKFWFFSHVAVESKTTICEYLNLKDADLHPHKSNGAMFIKCRTSSPLKFHRNFCLGPTKAKNITPSRNCQVPSRLHAQTICETVNCCLYLAKLFRFDYFDQKRRRVPAPRPLAGAGRDCQNKWKSSDGWSPIVDGRGWLWLAK